MGMPRRSPIETLADTTQDILRQRVGLLGVGSGAGVDVETVQQGAKYAAFIAYVKERMDEYAVSIAPSAPPTARSFVPEVLYRDICTVSSAIHVFISYHDTVVSI